MKQYTVTLHLARPIGGAYTDDAGPFRDRAAAERALVAALQAGVACGGDIVETESETDESES